MSPAAATVQDRPVAEPSAREAVSALENEFSLMFNRARVRLRARAERVHPDLQPSAYKALALIVHRGPQHSGALAQALGCDKSMVSRTVKQLFDLGFVTREADPDDGRASFVCATPSAAARVREVSREDRHLLQRWLDDWDVDDIRRLTQLLARLNAAGDDKPGAAEGSQNLRRADSAESVRTSGG